MQSADVDPVTLGFTVVSLGLALEEALKALAEQNGKQAGAWLDEVEELAILRAQGHLADAHQKDAVATAIAAVKSIFARMRSGFSDRKQ